MLEMNIKMIVTVLGFLLLIVGLLALGGGLLFLLAYGVGWVVNLFAHFEPFQVTIVSLAAICVFGFLAVNIWNAITSSARNAEDYDEFDYDDEYDDEYEDDEEDDDEDDEPPLIYPGIPRWRQPIKSPDFSKAKPDDRCPCGSGRKYKNCHGVKKAK
jgi:hypothetical protein